MFTVRQSILFAAATLLIVASMVTAAGAKCIGSTASPARFPYCVNLALNTTATADFYHLTAAAAMTTAKPEKKTKESITVTVLPGEKTGIKGPDGLHHDMMIPSNFVLHRNQKTMLIIYNYDEGPHTITCAGLGLNILIAPAIKAGRTPSKTVYSFTADKPGTYRWHCVIPCDGGAHHWAMSKSKQGPCKNGYMAGYFIVL